jgi:hypothetical protein
MALGQAPEVRFREIEQPRRVRQVLVNAGHVMITAESATAVSAPGGCRAETERPTQ